MKNKILSLIFACFAFWAVPVLADEKIESFDSLIEVQTDGSMIVTETITVHHEGVNIRRGIYRDLPTKQGEQYDLIGVNRNGQYEPSFVEKRSGYYRINTGDDSFLPQPGTSTFEIKYRVWNIPKAYKGYDEIYWNVTGDEWSFPIEQVSARVELPYGADIIQQASYMGYKGSREPATYDGKGQYTGRYLSPGEQLTIAVGFTPGVVSVKKKISLAPFFQVVLYVLYLTFLIWIWHKKGRDPAGRAIMPQYEPPKELTAAQAACLYKKGISYNLVPISLIQMISTGFLKLTTKTEKILFFTPTTYTLEKQQKAPSNPEEACIPKNKITLDGEYHKRIARLTKQIQDKIKKSTKVYYTNNYAWVLLPTIIFLLAFACVFAQKWINLGESWGHECIPIFILTAASLVPITSIANAIFKKDFVACVAPFIFLMFFYAGFYKPLIEYAKENWGNISPYIYDFKYEIVVLVATIITYILFTYLMYQPTEKGQRLIEHLEGLKMFLKATKLSTKEKLKMDEKLSQENMEKLFPYALALGLEKEWEKKFTDLFGVAVYSDFANQHPYTAHAFCNAFASNVSNCCGSHSGGSGSGSCGGGCSGGGGGGGR